jgi:hypothetical protein
VPPPTSRWDLRGIRRLDELARNISNSGGRKNVFQSVSLDLSSLTEIRTFLLTLLFWRHNMLFYLQTLQLNQ